MNEIVRSGFASDSRQIRRIQSVPYSMELTGIRTMRVYCDFDGTITSCDTTDHVLEHLANPAWRSLESAWLAGRIDAAECMRRQIALVGGGNAELDAVLDGVTVTPGFQELACWCNERNVPLVIVSDGVDYFIRRILTRYGLEHLPVIANRLSGEAGARRLEQPWLRADCTAGSGVCKCAVTRPQSGEPRTSVVYIGDGRSDFCVAGRADLLFAKAKLERYAQDRGLPFLPFTDFHDVLQTLAALGSPDTRRLPATAG